jgi:hypothetical protein
MKPSKPIATNAACQPKATASRPTIGPAIAPPSGVPQLAMPTALAASRCGNQLFLTLLIVEESGPSPTPKKTRMTNSETNPVAAAVKAQNVDQTAIASVNTRLPPSRSAAQPPMKLKMA